ncbi:MAG TPA: Maf family protein [Xanthomonadales bacterium]|nr:Maf family protein [Xanthomonadales bacterium]
MSHQVTDDQAAQLILASASPRRHELLRQLGVIYRVVVSDADESSLPGENPADYVCRVARNKAEAVAGRDDSGLPVLGADTAVVIGGQILGKPGSEDEAAVMLRMLSGQVHQVYSAVVLVCPNRQVSSRLNITEVRFAELDNDWIAAYVATGEPMDKAGSYGVQGCAAHRISEIRGSYSGVMGLPLYETMELLHASGFNLSPCCNLKS